MAELQETAMLGHTRTIFDADLHELARMVAEMGGLAERQVAQAFDALAQRNTKLAYKIIDRDAGLDAFQTDIEAKGITIIAQRQPVAIDLREIISALHICSDLERIGDLAKNIGKRTIAIGSDTLPMSLLRGLAHMAIMVMTQLKTALESYAARDIRAALAVRDEDLQIDALNNALFHETLAYMGGDPRNIVTCTQLLFCIKNLERIGDRATNIAEAVHYLVSGHLPAGERPKGNNTGFSAFHA